MRALRLRLRTNAGTILTWSCFLLGVLAAGPSGSAVFTVGPGGDFDRVQIAILAAIDNLGDDEVRIARGTFVEQMFIGGFSEDHLLVSGGWDPGFATRTGNRTTTILSGAPAPLAGTTIDTNIDGFTVVIENLTIRDGAPNVEVFVFDGGSLTIRNSVISHGKQTDDSTVGGGIDAFVDEGGTLRIEGSQLSDNVAATAGGAIFLSARGDADVTLVGNKILRNQARNIGGGLHLNAHDESRLTVEDNEISRNTVASSTGFGPGLYVSVKSQASAVLRRNRLLTNSVKNGGGAQVAIEVSGDGELRLTDSTIARSPAHGSGIELFADDRAKLFLTNLTVVDNDEKGIIGSALGNTSTVRLTNNIVSGHDVNLQLSSRVVQKSTIQGATDPQFVNRSAGNYRLKSTSPAVNKGANAPAGGRGPLDLDKKPRVAGGRIDIGAYESF